MNGCDHKCHKVGLNPWVYRCPVCGCSNPEYDPSIPFPQNFDELMAALEKADDNRRESEAKETQA